MRSGIRSELQELTEHERDIGLAHVFPDLSAVDAVRLYKELSEVERCFANLKDVIDLWPDQSRHQYYQLLSDRPPGGKGKHGLGLQSLRMRRRRYTICVISLPA